MDTQIKQPIKGGEFIIKETSCNDIFIPEEFTEEQRMMAETAEQFLESEVWPLVQRLDNHEEGLMQSLLDKAGELGLLSVSVPEQYNGLGKDFLTGMLITEILGAGHSFSVAMAAHTGIGTLPILYFGTAEQKHKYIPRLATGEWKASYCLTEPGSGSDALAAKTKAVLTPDGKHYLINGQKMWITNAGFADVFTVFAQVDPESTPDNKGGFTGFIIEKTTPGISLGEEEDKMGIKGSSTRQVFFTDCKIPAENLLGEIGKGHLIAFNILNLGRAKLAAAALGGSKRVCTLSITYANERQQFKLPISKFGAIRHKLAQQAIRTYAVESALYRLSHNIDMKEKSLLDSGMPESEATLKAAEEYAVECAILKIAGSEALDYVTDEGVQIYGGYGYSAEYPMDRAYRDSRINRIFEGTNEINRLLTVDMLLKRAMKGELDLMTAATNVQKELMGIPEPGSSDSSLFAHEKKALSDMKKCILLTAGAAVQKLMTTLAKEQEILMNIADIAIDIYMAESLMLRIEKLVKDQGESTCREKIEIMKVYFYDAMDRIHINARTAVNSFAEGDEQRMLLLGIKRFTKYDNVNTKQSRQVIAKKLIEENRYCF
ncbi:MAG: acyl-CoA dehydrogenase family protein [Bacteroidia bacterium]|nr:acyl-CoA dehydrogenase family protein [Bacteroidia bacterium]MCZ2276864.1 acyl-CoA dehydrogenase family protein [Bacteroidia bacterium]